MSEILEELIEKHQNLAVCKADIERAFLLLRDCYKAGGRVFVCGNGGSSSDAEHIVGELLKSFKKKRDIKTDVYEKLTTMGEGGKFLSEKLEGALAAYSLNSQTAIMTAYANDKSWDAVYAQQLYALGKAGDVLIALSTSGNSKNCVYAITVANAIGISSLALTGIGGGEMKRLASCTVAVPESETYKVQELHLPIYHALCAMLEEEFF